MERTAAGETDTEATTKHPDLLLAKSGFESVFVDKEAILPQNRRLPAASGKIGVVGKIGLIRMI